MSTKTAAERAPGFAKHPDYRITFEPCAKRVRAIFNDEVVVDSRNARLLHETRHIPVYYFPRDEVRMDLLTPTDHKTFCPFKGEASYFSVTAGGRTAENAVWSYAQPFGEVAEIQDYLAFYWNKMDRWLEEDEEVSVHARDPYVRVDILPSSRPVEVILGGESVARSSRAWFLFETGLPTRYYLPAQDVRIDLMVPSDSRSACPYKGIAHYYSAKIGDRLYEDIAWTYPDPLPESERVRNLICFYNERVDSILLEGREVPRPRTKWSQD